MNPLLHDEDGLCILRLNPDIQGTFVLQICCEFCQSNFSFDIWLSLEAQGLYGLNVCFGYYIIRNLLLLKELNPATKPYVEKILNLSHSEFLAFKFPDVLRCFGDII